jgi:predicted HD phosphohydrolase
MSLVELLTLLEQLGSTPSNDVGGLTELDHGLQCAFELAARRPSDRELQVAGLVHDIGHQFGPDERHSSLGADAVRPVLGDRVADLVDAHVVAKRYLVATDPSYLSRLSADSTSTLAVQGGPLGRAEAEAFRMSRHFEDALELRRADDAAKVPGRPVPGLDHWAPLVIDVGRGAA